MTTLEAQRTAKVEELMRANAVIQQLRDERDALRVKYRTGQCDEPKQLAKAEARLIELNAEIDRRAEESHRLNNVDLAAINAALSAASAANGRNFFPSQPKRIANRIFTAADAAREIVLTGTLDERYAQLAVIEDAYRTARQKLEDERVALEGPAKYGDAKAIKRHDDLVDQIEAMRPRGWYLQTMRSQLDAERTAEREAQRLNRALASLSF